MMPAASLAGYVTVGEPTAVDPSERNSSATSSAAGWRSGTAAGLTAPAVSMSMPPLRVDPAQKPRLEEIHANLGDRLQEAKEQGWLGEVAAIEATLAAAAAQKLQAMRDLTTRPASSHRNAGRPSSGRATESKPVTFPGLHADNRRAGTHSTSERRSFLQRGGLLDRRGGPLENELHARG
jgi:hypothetical protein